MKIAFASKDNIHVNQHFGWCEKFYIYEIDGDNFSLVDEIDSSLQKDEEVEKLNYKISCVDGCDIIYVSQIGPKAANMVQSAGIYPMRSSSEDEKIEDVINSLQKMINGNAPLWLKRILLKDSQNG
ncbi:MAG: NifB/NifX family molybdenum-iron cluster-binding protein [Campylobacterota bacterium]|nr:NifB/NifX family molybdenum-iron cluster-binding protein [Campylobacterota bacterium]